MDQTSSQTAATKDPITIETTINASIDKVWECWTNPKHIAGWAFASDDWEALNVKNDLREGGKFSTTMSAKDKSASFDFAGVYTSVIENESIAYDMVEGRHVETIFQETDEGTKVTQTFDPESENSREVQESGWQSILDNFGRYAEKAESFVF